MSKKDNDRLQSALMRDKLAGLRMERGDFKGAMEALRDAPESKQALSLPSNLDAAESNRVGCSSTPRSGPI